MLFLDYFIIGFATVSIFFNIAYNAIQTLAKRLFSDMKMKYLQMMNIDEHKILQGFWGTHVPERTRTLQGPFIAIN